LASWPTFLLGMTHVASRTALLIAAVLIRPSNAVRGDAVGYGYFGALPKANSEPYLKLVRTDYKFKLQGPYMEYTIDILVDPCRNKVQTGGRGDDCCNEVNFANCQHHPRVTAGPDLTVAFFQNAHIPNCRGTPFENDPNCGTFLEVHRKGDSTLVSDARIDDVPFPSGYRTTNVETHRLCLGEHELWWVVRTRSGPYVQAIRDFYITGPSCEPPAGLDFQSPPPVPDGTMP